MTSALIGHTGFVGSNLLRQGHYDAMFNSRNIDDIRGRSFDRVVCAGAPGEKWRANQNCEEDGRAISRLVDCIRYCSAKVFTLISTIDVRSKTPYGKHRNMLEKYVETFSRWWPDDGQPFGKIHIVRLPALFGDGLRKNVLFDLIHGWRLDEIKSDSRYQWYPVARLGNDLNVIEATDAKSVDISTEPIAVSELVNRFFPTTSVGPGHGRAATYDVHTKHAALWGRTGPYIMSKGEVLDEMAAFLEGETV